MKRLYILLSLLLWSIPNIANAQFTRFGPGHTTTGEREMQAQRRFNEKFFGGSKAYQSAKKKKPRIHYSYLLAVENTVNEATGLTTLRWADGSSYVGLTDRGAIFVGTMTYADGSKYIGKWERNLPNGEGTFVNPEGVAFTGKFEDGIPRGKCIIQDVDGRKYKARWGWGTGKLLKHSIRPLKKKK